MSSQSQGDSAGSSSSSSTESKKQNQSRRGISSKVHHGRLPQTPVCGKEDNGSSAQRRIRNLQQKSQSHEKSTDYKLRPQTGRFEHSKVTDSKPPQRSGPSGQPKNKGNHHRKPQNSQPHDTDNTDTKPKRASSKSFHRDIKRTESKDSGIGHSPPSVDPQNELESTDTSVAELSNGGIEDGEPEEQVKVVRTETEEQPESTAGKPEINRLHYSREILLALRQSEASQRKHPALDKSIDITFLKQSSLPSQAIESEGESKKKHPTALSLIKDHDVRQLPKVSLSPQRKSFHGGCSWNESKAPSSAPAFSKDLSKFDFESPYPPTSKYNQGSFQQSDTPSTKHKVIDHIPLRDQKLDRGDKKNWRDRGKEPEWARDNHHHNTWEEEPEWMEYGPNDRYELIELKGLDEHEREREARLGREESENKTQGRTDDSPAAEVQGSPEQLPITKSTGIDDPAPSVTEGGKESGESNKREDMLKAAMEMDSFMLEGFDFSTGLSFCHALDEEEEELRSPRSPADVSTALMKMLKVGDEGKSVSSKDKVETILGVSSRPVNALTLDEIHARENIETSPIVPITKSGGEDLGAFNKLVAGLQSSGALNKDNTEQPVQHKVKPSPSTPSKPTLTSPISLPSMSVPGSTVSVPFHTEKVKTPQNTFGNMLEKEIDFEEEVISGSHPHYQQCPVPPEISPQHQNRASRVEHLERILEKLDQDHLRHKLPPEAPPHMPSGYHDHHMKGKLLPPGHGVRISMEGQRSMHMMDRDFMYPDGEPRMDMLPPPNIGIRPQGGVSRPTSSNWAIEMERRRVLELRQMERARVERAMFNSMHGGMMPKMREIAPPKPNISLLPTAVMRQMHNSKPNQSLSDVTKSSSAISSRIDQDHSNKASFIHTPISNAYQEPDHPPPRMHPSQLYGMGGGGMRSMPTPFRPDPPAMMYRSYYNMPVMPQGGMQNPYMY